MIKRRAFEYAHGWRSCVAQLVVVYNANTPAGGIFNGRSAMTYTTTQLDREIQLVLWGTFHDVERIRGEGFGFAALGIADDEEFRGDLLAESIPLKGEFVEEAYRLHRYVMLQQRYPDKVIAADLLMFGYSLLGAFPQWRIDEFKQQAAQHPDPDARSYGIGEGPSYSQAPGHHYRGILKRLHELASLRFKIDQDELLTLAEIASLLELKETTVVTAAIRGQFPTEADENRRWARPSDVLPWLVERGYQPTREVSADVAETVEATDDYVFVPIAADGTWFSPTCRLGSGYTIGAKGEERKVGDYWTALEQLARQRTPRWRRKNPNGNWGIVAGQTAWHRVRRAEIEKALAEQQP
jgi:hypothetical protein